MITKEEVRELLCSTETYRVERTVSTSDMDKFQEAICAFSNDLPNSRKKGYLIIGAHDNGTLSGLKVTDALLKKTPVPQNTVQAPDHCQIQACSAFSAFSGAKSSLLTSAVSLSGRLRFSLISSLIGFPYVVCCE